MMVKRFSFKFSFLQVMNTDRVLENVIGRRCNESLNSSQDKTLHVFDCDTVVMSIVLVLF